MSSRPNGVRSGWRNLWKLNIPYKVKVFAWKLGNNGLAVKKNKMSRNIVADDICDVCGQVPEDGHHAAIGCRHATTLRNAMREHWCLSPEADLHYSGPEWFLSLLGRLDEATAASLVLILWRAWAARNDITHSTRGPGIGKSVSFLLRLEDSLLNVRQDRETDKKGKGALVPELRRPTTQPSRARNCWSPPEPGRCKINVDGSCSTSGGEAGRKGYSLSLEVDPWSGGRRGN